MQRPCPEQASGHDWLVSISMVFAGTDAANTMRVDSHGFSCEDDDDDDVHRDGHLDVLSTANRNVTVINATKDIFRSDIKVDDDFSIITITAATAARQPDVCQVPTPSLSLSHFPSDYCFLLFSDFPRSQYFSLLLSILYTYIHSLISISPKSPYCSPLPSPAPHLHLFTLILLLDFE